MVLHLVPGNPAQVIAGPDAPPETVRQIEVELGLDKPQPEQYAIYLGRVVLGRHVLLNMGAMVSTARQYIATAPHTFAYPTLAIS